ncbi:MAG: beta-phosphoglucomutase family hydrolase [Bacteroidetes bacterium]|jgi:beta-phosphoglucomutase family hydrolase|nr:beta-phosphoglucomutase family hydrolase [Bacteroidota bacterium]MBT6685532.1 beta-phosphoglucomutase family hydrolase [Bacteroidota bacterium]MBT7144967.1 beta-phosphoglucomutase family hydrolase [Bacteroidota bacterium]MBT7492483.1 beta-phosphoglucomutase family hydrolase [Bacteroidota bacterium]
MNKFGFDGVIFDLDGVITQTALVHSAAWKKMFNDFLLFRENQFGEKFVEFTHEADYLPYVDGKPRYEGVESFLNSRNISLPQGSPADSPDEQTICGLGNKKNQAFNEVLQNEGVKVFDSTVDLLKTLKNKDLKIGVASSSKNCEAVLKAANLTDYFETRVDGVVSAEQGLKGKPEPEIFTKACDNLNIDYHRAVVIEDAVSGVQAGAKGNFGFVLGIARENNEHELKLNGADIVVKDISEIGFDGITKWFQEGIENDGWQINYYDYNAKKEATRETLTAVGNGFFGTRGAMEENLANSVNYPGTYMAGLYNRLTSKIGDKDIDNQDFVNCPNWLSISFKIGSNDFFDINKNSISNFQRSLCLKTGLLYRKLIVSDDEGRKTLVESWRVASMYNKNLASLKYKISPLNYSENITVVSKLDGNIINNGVARYRQLNQKHIEHVSSSFEENIGFLCVKTTNSDIEVTETAKITVKINNQEINPDFSWKKESACVSNTFTTFVEKGTELQVEKIVSINKAENKEAAKINLFESDKQNLLNYNSFDEIYNESKKSWKEIWEKADIQINGDRLSQKLLRLHIYHLLISASPHNKNIDASITARGLHGEAYRGHIFWDELFILPFYNIHFKEVAKSMLMYRYRRLDAAKEYAQQNSYKGAMFPWQSGSDGREETQLIHLNPITEKWGEDYSSLQKHVSLAVAFNIWKYFQISDDKEFLEKYGLEMFIEICRFWSSKALLNAKTKRYEIFKVMGPDEFHEKYPLCMVGGIKDNAYTNIMTVWAFKKAHELINILSEKSKAELFNKIGLSEEELAHWKNISKNLNLDISEDGKIAQFDGYFNLKELDWEYYKQKYDNIHRMDRILKSEGKSSDEFQLAKQADTLMLFYNLEIGDVREIVEDLGYKLPKDFVERNLNYYFARTSHGSTLSRVVHSQLAEMIGNKKLGEELFKNALISDFQDSQGGTTGEGIHSGVMAGTIMHVINNFAGINLNSENLRINPNLPFGWKNIKFQLNFKNVLYKISIGKEYLSLETDNSVDVEILGQKYSIQSNSAFKLQLAKS